MIQRSLVALALCCVAGCSNPSSPGDHGAIPGPSPEASGGHTPGVGPAPPEAERGAKDEQAGGGATDASQDAGRPRGDAGGARLPTESVDGRAVATSAPVGTTSRRRQALLSEIHRDPDSLEAWQGLVDLLLGQGEPGDVVSFLRDRLQSRGKAAGSLFGLAYALATIGTPEGMAEADDLLAEACRLRPDLPALAMTRAEVLSALGRHEDAARLLARVKTGDWAVDGQAKVRRGQLLLAAGDPAAARAFEEAARAGRAHSDAGTEVLALRGLVTAAMLTGEPSKALEVARRAVRAGRGDLDAKAAASMDLAWVLESMGRIPDALAVYHRMTQELDEAGMEDRAALVRLGAGELLARSGRLAEAVVALQAAVDRLQAMDAWPKAGEGMLAMARAYRDSARYEDALRLYGDCVALQKALVSATGDHGPLVVVLRELGALEGEAGRLQDASRHLDEALSLAQESGDEAEQVRILTAMARVAVAAHDVDRAKGLLESLRQAGASDPVASAQLLAETGRLDEAIGAAAMGVAQAVGLDDLHEQEVRLSVEMRLRLRRGREEDIRRALALAAAGRQIGVARLLGSLGVRATRGADPGMVARGLGLMARVRAIERIGESVAAQAVAGVWNERLRAAKAALVGWRKEAASKAPAFAQTWFFEVVIDQVQTYRPAGDRVLIYPQAGPDETVFFVVGNDQAEAVPVEGAPDRDRVVELVQRIVRDHVRGSPILVPMPGTQAFGWGMTMAPGPVVPGAMKPKSRGAVALPADATVEGLYDGAVPAGDVVEISLRDHELTPAVHQNLELMVRAAMFAGAREVRVDVGGSKPLVYVRP